MKWDLYTDKGIRGNNEDSCGAGFLQGDKYLMDLWIDDKELEKTTKFSIEGSKLKLQDTGESVEIDHLPKNFYAFAVADGLGGHAQGEVASEWAIRSFIPMIFYKIVNGKNEVQNLIEESYAIAGGYIKEHISAEAGTTLVSAVVIDDKLYVANLGDSRCYVFKDGKLVMRTKDHSFVQSLVDAGVITEEEAREHPKRNILLKALGMDNSKPDVYKLGDNWDSFLLCSDGFSGVFTDEEILELMKEERSAKGLVELAIERGSDDNVSVIVGWR